MSDAGLFVRTADDITDGVSKTWNIGKTILKKPIVRGILRTADPATIAFVSSFDDIAQAFAEGLMTYGMFTAVKERPS
jgi:hypothetical protein